MRLRNLAVVTALVVLCSGTGRADDTDFFEKKIRPVFVEHCYKCHSDQAKKLKGGLRLDTVAGIAATGVDFISVGAITHSVKALDLALDFVSRV